MKDFIVSKNTLTKNFHVIRQKAGSARIMAVLKSNAYGLGLLPMAGFCREMGISRFGVTEAGDAAILRNQGFVQEEIYMLRSTAIPDEIELLLDNNVVAAVGSQEAALAVSALAEKRSAIAEVHIKIDTGLGRYGFLPSEFDKIRSVYEYMSAIAVTGIFTHLPHNLPPKKAELQSSEFEGVLEGLRKASLETGTVHALGSTALFRYKNPPVYDMVRIGAAFGGRICADKTGLSPAGALHAPLSDIRWMPPGSVVGGKKRLRKPMKTGIVPIGISDGFCVEPAPDGIGGYFRRMFLWRAPCVQSEGGEVLQIIGRIGHNHCVVDITHARCNIGDMVRATVNPLFVPPGNRRFE